MAFCVFAVQLLLPGSLKQNWPIRLQEITINFNQSWLNQSRVDGKQKKKNLELFTVCIIMWSDCPVSSDPGNSSCTVSAKAIPSNFTVLLDGTYASVNKFQQCPSPHPTGPLTAAHTFLPAWDPDLARKISSIIYGGKRVMPYAYVRKIGYYW